MSKKYLDLTGLKTYHQGVTNALNDKENKKYVGDSAPTETKIDIVWLDTSGDQEEQEISLLSEDSDEGELTFNSDTDDGLTFESDSEEELTFNPDIE